MECNDNERFFYAALSGRRGRYVAFYPGRYPYRVFPGAKLY